jgi:hypothetical protein
LNSTKQGCSSAEQKVVTDIQQTMRRVWLDNQLLVGLEEMRAIMAQITQAAGESQEWLGRKGDFPGKPEVLHKEWEYKEAVLEELVGHLTAVLQQYRQERRLLERHMFPEDETDAVSESSEFCFCPERGHGLVTRPREQDKK